MKASNGKVDNSDLQLFRGEKLLVMISLLGFVLAIGVALYIGIFGNVVLPEGNLDRAFSFDAAIALFLLSIAAILPISGLSSRKRAAARWFFIPAILYAYAIETIQHFRGINPRFSKAGSNTVDSIAGALFGLDSLLIIIVVVLLAISFYRKRQMNERPLVVLGIRYAFLSIMFAFASGLWMIVLQSRYTGESGNLIVLHGLSFHALQALPLLGWLSERTRIEKKHTRRLIHFGSLAWTISILLISIQTVLGHSIFEWTILPIVSGIMLLTWLASVVTAIFNLFWPKTVILDQSSHSD
ncbi:hypothetical protein SC499_21210 [Peribacillus simplex]|uniref:hypothetical protein n=1 Tax=Peribacillus simplex TaxID=1478 RepID=UPI00298DF29A|nr:hypothetical protein [Peribacillus simplex]MDW7617131.1 hypothetical protein [Peribacillus simplex]